MTSLLVPILAASPRATAFALDCAHARARGRAWIADFDTDPKSAVEEVGLLVLALAHGAQGASVRGRVLGNVSDLFTDAPAQDRGLGIETTRREGTGREKSGVEARAPESAGLEGRGVEGTRRDVQSTPRILCVDHAHSLVRGPTLARELLGSGLLPRNPRSPGVQRNTSGLEGNTPEGT
ncbi:hypothetical protein JFX23_03610 [Schaalia cardiffensis]|uniref:hypothetical protein n=1 Tax=Schaalia cardiffensis TaxID=181487 RepID=UPI0018E8ACED|nr:hypothetical protein [Schaalia cardiffensis]MBJ2328863.1 hypothetical protein [Schaalia cardiffensis]